MNLDGNEVELEISILGYYELCCLVVYSRNENIPGLENTSYFINPYYKLKIYI